MAQAPFTARPTWLEPALWALPWLLTGVALCADALGWAHTHAGWPLHGPWADVSRWSRYGRTVLCALLVLWVWRQRWEHRDAQWLAGALAVCVVADTFLILRHQLLLGIAIFGLAQVALIVRHLRWLRRPGALPRPAVAWVVVVCLAVGVVGNAALAPPLSRLGLMGPVMAYSVLLLTACGSAALLRHHPQVPPALAQSAFWGTLLFVLCDLSVGIGAAFKGSPWADAIRACTGLVYTPALIALVRSVGPANDQRVGGSGSIDGQGPQRA
jgi:hypothetical protein